MPTELQVAYVNLPNFGDQLNRLLLPRALDGLAVANRPIGPFERIDGTAVYALGSFLGPRFFGQFNETFRGVVLGTGVGYAQFTPGVSLLPSSFPQRMIPQFDMPLPALGGSSKSAHVYWVRGPLSARMLRLPADRAIADAGYMLRQTDMTSYGRVAKSGVAVMTHNIASNFGLGLKEVCEGLGFDYIDSRAPLEETLARIGSAELLITEALHGAVVADALRTPWVTVRSSGAIHDMKWRDFTAAIGLEYRPLNLRVRWDYAPKWTGNVRSTMRSLAVSAGAAISRAVVSDRDTAVDLLRASATPPMLSSDAVLASVDERIAQKLEQVRRDFS